jgi:uncharacterized membrane protein YbhN (UPF0104 family)
VARGGAIARAASHRTIFIFVTVTAALTAFILYRIRTAGFDWAEFVRTFRGVHGGWLAASAFAIILTYFGRALRWQVMVRPVKPDSSAWNIFVCTAIGFTAIVFFGRAGELVRPYLVSVKERVSFSSQMAAWLLERVLDLLMVLLIFGIALSQIPHTGFTPGPHLKVVLQAGGIILGVAGAACLLMLLAFRLFSDAMHRRLMSAIAFLPQRYQNRIGEVLAAFSQGLGSTRSNAVIGLLLAYSVLEWILIIGCFVCLFRAFPATAGFPMIDVVVCMGFVSLGAAIQVHGVGGGIKVAPVNVLTELFGVSFESATGFAVALWAVTFLVIVPVGLILAFHEGLNWHNLRHVSEETPQ